MTETATANPSITEPQLRKLNVLLDQNGMSDRTDALAWISGVLGIDIESRKDLTLDEASRLIDMLADGQVRKADARDPQVPSVQEAVRRVMYDIGHVGVGKGGYNQTQNYRFRGVDQFVDALSPILSRHGVVLLPDCESPVVTEHPTSKGGKQFMVIMPVHWRIVGPAGDWLTATTIGQAMDSSDKAANKAMSAAFKYLLSQVFAIPHDGWNDGDNDHPEVGPEPEVDNTDLMDKVAAFAVAEGMTMEEFTAKFRADNGGRTVAEMAHAPRSLLQAYVSRIERFKAQQQ